MKRLKVLKTYEVRIKPTASLLDIVNFLNNMGITVDEGTSGFEFLISNPEFIILKEKKTI